MRIRPLNFRLGKLQEVVPSWSWRRTLALATTVTVFLIVLDWSLQPVVGVDTDTWWHLAGGRLMFATHRLALIDTFSFTEYGHVWVNRHWLFQLMAYGFYATGGVGGLVVMRTVLDLATFGLLVAVARRRGAGYAAVAVSVVWAAWISSFYSLIRPQYASLLAGATCLWLLDRARRCDRRLAWGVPVVIAVWSNMHGGVSLVGVAMVMAYAAADTFEPFLQRLSTHRAAAAADEGRDGSGQSSGPDSQTQETTVAVDAPPPQVAEQPHDVHLVAIGARARLWIWVLIASICALWVTPQPFESLYYVVQMSFTTNPYRNFILEFQPLQPFAPENRLLLIFMVVCLLGAFRDLGRKRILDVLLVVGFGSIILRMVRHQYLLVPMLVPSMAVALQEGLEQIPHLWQIVRMRKRSTNSSGNALREDGSRDAFGTGRPVGARHRSAWIVPAIMTFLVLAVGVREGVAVVRRDLPPGRLMRLATLPEGAVRFILAHNLRGPIFNDLNWGGWLLWRLAGHNQVFIDGRNDAVYPASLLPDYFGTLTGRSGLTVLNRRHINLVVVQPGLAPPLEALIRASRSWVCCFDDSVSRVYVRRRFAIANHLSLVSTSSPDGRPWFLDFYKRGSDLIPQHLRAATALLKTAVSLAPDSPRCYVRLGYACALAGHLRQARRNWLHALFLTPYLRGVHANLAEIALHQGNLSEAGAELMEEYAMFGDPAMARKLARVGHTGLMAWLRIGWNRFCLPFYRW